MIAPVSIVTLANLLSLSRIPLGVCLLLAATASQWWLAAGLLWLAVATDLLDGHLARARGQAGAIGTALDHGSDALFVTLGLAALACHGWAPWLLPALVPLAFLQYLLDSGALAGQPLRASPLGRYNGIAYYLLAGAPVMQQALGLAVIPYAYFVHLGWGLVATTLISMLDRLWALCKLRLR